MKFIIMSLIFHVILIWGFSNSENREIIEQKKEIINVEFLNDDMEKIQNPVVIEKRISLPNREIVKKNIVEQVSNNTRTSSQSETEKSLESNLDTKVSEQKEIAIQNNTETPVAMVETNKTNLTSEVTASYVSKSNESTKNSDSINTDFSSQQKISTISKELTSSNYIAKNQDIEGLNYKILASSDPDYPILAKKANYKNTVIVKTRFLVNGEGKIEEIKFYDEEIKFGFHDEVEKSLKKWKFSPVKLNGVAAKMYFYKTFVFKLSY